MTSTRRIASLAGLAAATLLAAPAIAPAANTFVNATRPDDSGNCLTLATACKTIGGGIAKAGPGNTVFVIDPAVPTTYAESVSLDSGKSLVALSALSTETIIDNGTGMGGTTPAVLIPPGGGGGTIRGFTVRSDYQAILARDPITLVSNRFDESETLTSASDSLVELAAGAGGSSLTGNVFLDPSPLTTETQRALLIASSANVSGNAFAGFSRAITTAGASATPVISGNAISATHPDTEDGIAIHASLGNPIIAGNLIHNPSLPLATDVVTGVVVEGTAGAALQRNRIFDHTNGVVVSDAPGVSLEGDLIARSAVHGLRAADTGIDQAGPGDVSVTGATIVESDPLGREIQANQTAITIESTIVGARGIGGNGTCSISHSRGPSTSGGSCRDFQTSASPGFVSPGSDYHLAAGSAMIDAGDPNAPPFGSIDLDGDPRAVDAALPCGVRRDIGADEFGVPIDCQSPDTIVRGRTKHRSKRKRARVSFTLASTELGSFFQCSIDDGGFFLCATPFVRKLGRGKHVLTVRSVDLSGNVDTSPARVGIRIARKKRGRRR